MSELEDELHFQMKAAGLPAPETEYRFGAHACGGPGKGLKARLADARLKDWRFDFSWPDLMIAVEVEGGGWTGGRHTRGSGFAKDMQKYHHAIRLGWSLYRCDGALIRSGDALQVIEQLVKGKANES